MSDVTRSDTKLMITTEYETEIQHNIRVYVVKDKQFKIVFPRHYNTPPKKSRPYCTFSHLLGVSVALHTRIGKALKAVVQQFLTVEDGRKWCQQEKLQWLKKVTQSWRSHLKQTAKQVKPQVTRECRLEAYTSTRVYNNDKRATKTIPLPAFLKMGSGSNKVTQISINTKKNSRSEGGHVTISFPKGFRTKDQVLKRTVTRSMGTKHGDSPGWLNFVSEYMLYTMTRWKNDNQARSWLHFEYDNFKKMLERYFDELGCPETRTWRIGISKIESLNRSNYHRGAAKDPGCGLFATTDGEVTLVFDGRSSRITERIDTREKKLHDIQRYYQVQIGTCKEVVDVPTIAALRAGVISHGFIANDDSNNPTMQLGDDTLTNLLPTPKDTEFAFDYGYDDKTNKKLETAPDPPISLLSDTDSEQDSDNLPNKQQKISVPRKRKPTRQKRVSTPNPNLTGNRLLSAHCTTASTKDTKS